METILVVDDCFEVLDAISLVLDSAGYNVVCTMEPQRAIELCGDVNFDLVLCDLFMSPPLPGPRTAIAGMEMIWKMRDQYPKVPIVAMSGGVDEERLEQLTKRGVTAVLRKPFRSEWLLKIVAQALAEAESQCPRAAVAQGR